MKNILMMILGVGVTLGAAAAQPKVASTGTIGGAPAKVIVVRPYTYAPYASYRFGYNPFYSPFYGYNSFYYSPFGYQHRPTSLDLKMEQITNDYHHEIANARHDATLSKAEKRQKIRDLRHDRQNSIIDARKNYYEKRSTTAG